jgi:hypothetical protein
VFRVTDLINPNPNFQFVALTDNTATSEAALAIKLVHPKRKRVVNLTDEQKQVLWDRPQSTRAKHPVLSVN